MKKWGTLLLVSAAMFIIVIDTTIMNVSISALVEDLDTTVGGIQGAISLYALVMASFILIGGKLADLVGKRRIFLIGVVIFGTGTSIAAVSQSLGMLLFGWSLLEGIGSALMLPNTQTLLRARYEGQERATGYGVLASVGAIGAAVGPIVGGFLTTFYTWRYAFAFEVIIVVLVLLLRKHLPADEPIESPPRFDFGAAAFSILGWSCIVLGILLGGDYGFWEAKQPFVIGGLEIAPFGLSITPFLILFGGLSIAALLRWEERRVAAGQDVLFHPEILRIPRIRPGFFTRFLQMAITASFLFALPLLLQTSFSFTAMQTGIALLPFSAAVLVAALAGARFGARFPPRSQILMGFAFCITGLLVLAATITPEASAADLALGLPIGAGVGMIGAQVLNLVLSMGSEQQTPEVAGLNGTFEQLGNSIGVALVGTIMIVSLTRGTVEAIAANPDIPSEQQAAMVASAEQGIEVMSDEQLRAEMDAAGVPQEVREQVLAGYNESRAQAFRSSMVFLAFLALIGLFVAWRLPNKSLVDDEEADGDAGALEDRTAAAA